MIKNRIFAFLVASVVSVTVLGNSVFVSAEEPEIDNNAVVVSVGDQESVSTEDSETETFAFTSIDDETGLATSGLPIKTRQTSGILWTYTYNEGLSVQVTETLTATGDSTINKEFVRYLTTSWAKASSYTWSQSQSVSWTVTGDATWGETVKTKLGLSASRTTTYGVGVTIPADSSKYSKLSFKSDFFVQNYKYSMVVNGVTTRTDTGSVKSPTVNSYLVVDYQ